LPGVIAAHTVLPVIGVPIKSAALGGVDALYSIVQMPKGIPVATVAIDGAKNAGILAVQILALKNKELRKKLHEFKETMALEVEKKAEKLKRLGIKAYLDER
jgi:5-(carboxyamino)imidazole ribonucleotide mutase